MKIAVIGAGVAGLGAAWLLSRKHDVVVYEREGRFGGHSCTVDAPTAAGHQPVDVGFIVFNQRNYPNLVALFDHLGVPTETSDMSFAASLESGRFEYSSSFAGYFAQRRNVMRPSFLRMTHDILRFNRLAPRLLDRSENLDFTIGDFVDDAGLSDAFRDRYLVPMAACIWSTPLGRMLDYPAQTFVRFFDNHGLLTVGPQLHWRTVSGGSRSYVERIVAPLRRRARLSTPASAVRRLPEGVEVRDTAGHWDRFDKVVLACHADQALALLGDADASERDLLGRFAYSSNEVWLHADPRLMPRRRSVWSSWNYVADRSADSRPPEPRQRDLLDEPPAEPAREHAALRLGQSRPRAAAGGRPTPASPSSIRCTTRRRSAPSATCTGSRACATPTSAAATAATASTRTPCRPASTSPNSWACAAPGPGRASTAASAIRRGSWPTAPRSILSPCRWPRGSRRKCHDRRRPHHRRRRRSSTGGCGRATTRSAIASPISASAWTRWTARPGAG